MKAGRKWQSRISIVFAGVALGYLARLIWPPPVENEPPLREFTDQLTEVNAPISADLIGELPILPVEDNFELPLPYEFPSKSRPSSVQ